MDRESLGKLMHEAYWDVAREKNPTMRWPTWDKCNWKEDWFIVADKVLEKLNESNNDTVSNRVHDGLQPPPGGESER